MKRPNFTPAFRLALRNCGHLVRTMDFTNVYGEHEDGDAYELYTEEELDRAQRDVADLLIELGKEKPKRGRCSHEKA